jgi:predicted patatin/cPLA2 family phospholipase
MSIRGVVLSAGGWRGYLHLGALAVLLKEVDPGLIKLWAGCSIGALLSFLMILGITPEQIMEWINEKGEPKLTPTFNLSTLITNFGLIDMQQLVTCIEELFLFCKKDKDLLRLSFDEVLNLTGKHLMVCAVDLDRGAIEYFSPVTSPDLVCIDAVLASCCVPGVFQAKRIHGRVYIDGGRLDRFPKEQAQNYLSAMLGEDSKEIAESVLFGVMLQKQDVGPVTNIASFLYRLLTVGATPHHPTDPDILYISDDGVTDGEQLYTKGMRACQRYFS